MFGRLNFTKTQALTGASLSVLALMIVPVQAQDNSAPVSLGPVTVQSDSDKNVLNHAPPVSTMPSATIQDTPQAVTVVTGETMKQQGNLKEARMVSAAAITMQRKMFGENSPEVLKSLRNVASVFESQKKYHEAEDTYRLALDGWRKRRF